MMMNISTYSQAFREAIPKMEKLAAAAKPGVADVWTVRELASSWSSMSVAHDVHAKNEDDVIFPALEALFPGTVSQKCRPGMKTYVPARLQPFCTLQHYPCCSLSCCVFLSLPWIFKPCSFVALPSLTDCTRGEPFGTCIVLPSMSEQSGQKRHLAFFLPRVSRLSTAGIMPKL